VAHEHGYAASRRHTSATATSYSATIAAREYGNAASGRDASTTPASTTAREYRNTSGGWHTSAATAVARQRNAGGLIRKKGEGLWAFPFPCYDLFHAIHMTSSHAMLFLWLTGIGLESLLVVRALASGWFKKYPFFFAYVMSVFLQDVFFLAVYRFRFRDYTPFYWWAEFFSVLIGCAVSWEIFRLVLGRYPGAGRMARNVLLFALIMVIVKGLAESLRGEISWPSTAVELERNLRVIQAVSLIVLAMLSFYYVIPLGRNVKGIFAGYGLFIATIVLVLTLRASVGNTFQASWVFLQPLCYTAVLVLWCQSLWRYEPATALESQSSIEEDYRSLALATQKGLHQTRAFLGKSMRP